MASISSELVQEAAALYFSCFYLLHRTESTQIFDFGEGEKSNLNLRPRCLIFSSLSLVSLPPLAL